MLSVPAGVPHLRGYTVAFLFAIGLVIQGGALWLRGTGDVHTFKAWALTALDRGVPNSYSTRLPPAEGVDRDNSLPDYPPLSVYLLAGVGRLALYVDPQMMVQSRVLTLFVKAPVILSCVCVFVLLLVAVARVTGDAALARVVALAYWLNPAFILNGPTLGYLDTLCWLPGVAAIFAASMGMAGTAGLLVATSVLIKPQGLFFLIPVASAAWGSQHFGLLRVALNGGVVVLLAVLPFYLMTPFGFLAGMQMNFHEDVLTGDAMNAWWIVNAVGAVWLHGLSVVHEPLVTPSLQTFIAHAGFNPRPWAAAFVFLVAASLFWRMRGRSGYAPLTAMCALVIHTYYVFAISVHENHLVYAIPLVGLTAIAVKRYVWLYAGVSALVTANLFLFYGLGRDFGAPARTGLFWPVSVLGALADIALLAYHAHLFRTTFLTERSSRCSLDTRASFVWRASSPAKAVRQSA